MQNVDKSTQEEIREHLESALTGTRYESLLKHDTPDLISFSYFVWCDMEELIKECYKECTDLLRESVTDLRDYLPDLSEYYAGSEAEIKPEL